MKLNKRMQTSKNLQSDKIIEHIHALPLLMLDKQQDEVILANMKTDSTATANRKKILVEHQQKQNK